MFDNPFTPLFGGRPNCFFGRDDILARFDRAMRDFGSDDRALFITGSRGYGKTTLLEQLSARARKNGRAVIDVGSDNPIAGIMRHLSPYNETTNIIDPELEINILGSGGRFHGGSSAKTLSYLREDFEYLFLKSCSEKGSQILITIDEIQKVSLEDVALISESFQMASRKGCDVMLAVAGLPQAHELIIQHDGCTFLRRAPHESLGPLTPCDVRQAFTETFAAIKGLSVNEQALEKIIALSKGHPYLMQLLGYYLVAEVNNRSIKKSYCAVEDDVDKIASSALDAYCSRALEPMVAVMPSMSVEYLRAMAQVLNEDRIAKTGDIANRLGKDQKQLSMVRQKLLREEMVCAPARGELAFKIPYLADYLLREETAQDSSVDVILEWKM